MSEVPRPSRTEARALIERWYRESLAAVDPEAAVASAMRWSDGSLQIDGREVPIAEDARVVAVAIGKAATAMARGASSALGDRIGQGLILTKVGHTDRAPFGWHCFEAAHPVPDERGVAATRDIVEVLGSLGAGDLALVLLSGGGSALLELPRPPLELADIQATTRLLLNAGAPIQDLNTVRSELSEVKGGGLRGIIGTATCVSVILSDVLGNDPTVIASGPTIPRPSEPDRALALLERYGVTSQVPSAVLDVLRSAPAREPIQSNRDVYQIVADNDRFIDEVERRVVADGPRPGVLRRRVEGEAREVAKSFLRNAREADAGFDVLIAGGEATVTVRGNGTGGRNTEFALAAAIEISREGIVDLVVASLASDGQDGAINAAGAIVDDGTVQRLAEAGIDAADALERNDSGAALERAGDLVVLGPTGTNVNDVYMAVRIDTSDGSSTSEDPR